MAGPLVVGTLKHWTGEYTSSVLVLAALMTCATVFSYVCLPIISPDALLKARPEVAGKYGTTEGETDGLINGDREPPPGHVQTVQLTRLSSC